MTDAARLDADVLILGAGPVGMTLALALAHTGSPLTTLLLDRGARGAHAADPRALALAHGTRQLLAPLGAWNEAAATPIHDIHVSQSGGFGRTLITREEQRLPALGYVMRYRDLAAALDARLAATPQIGRLDRCEVLATPPEDKGKGGAVAVRVRDAAGERTLRARLVVHAEGTPAAAPGVRVADYGQHAILAEVRPQPAHGQRAWERFTPDGPLALLPLGADYSVVFTVPAARAETLLGLDDAAFLAALQRQFGDRVRFDATSPRARFPLALRLRRELWHGREVWIGNTAQTLHPVSGQGFNLGIRDAWELATALQRGGDPGAAERLGAYARGRRLDRWGSVAFTDGIVRGFSNDFAPLRLARGLGLAALDLCPPARRFVAARMIWGARGW